MCGLAGIFSASRDNSGAKISTALAAMANRGPDGGGQESFALRHGDLHIGHRRLSIIDLSPSGRQPMRSECGRYWIVFNGEIYNYRELRRDLESNGIRFRTDTDTEVLLEAYKYWGEQALHKLVGMFAFVIFDEQEQSLNCFRDAFGIKPFFYSADRQFFVFASDVLALRKLSPVRHGANLQRAHDYLVLGLYDDKAETFFDGILQLAPGNHLEVKLNTPIDYTIKRWWNPEIAERRHLSFSDAVDLVRTEFLANVRLHLRSDVPLGAALSGGLDSSALVGAMRHLEPDADIYTFSYVAAEGATSEETWINVMNDFVGAKPIKVRIEADDLFSDLDEMIIAQGEPFGSTSIYASYRVYKAVRDAGVVVCLDGQGADEMFAGYHGYPHLRLRSLLERGEISAAYRFLQNWSDWPGRSKSDAVQRLIAEMLPQGLLSLGRRVVGRGTVKPWLNRDFLEAAGVDVRPYLLGRRDRSSRGRRLVEHERYQLGYGGLARLLRHGDRNSMRWSVESRVPFLTTRLAELALSLPEDFLISNTGETKSVFRAAMRDIVPDSILQRRDKVGFETPERNWIKTNRPAVEHILGGAEACQVFEIDKLWPELLSVFEGERPFSWQTWRILNYCRWFELVLSK